MIDNFLPSRDGHSLRVSAYALSIAKELKLNKKELTLVEASALLRDIGKVGINEEILSKHRVLTRAEKAEVGKHTLIGHIILSVFTNLPQILDGVKNHHEYWDGSGYPHGLGGNKQEV